MRTHRSSFNDFLTQKDQQDPDSYHLFWNERWTSRTFASRKPVAFDEIPKFEYRRPSVQSLLTDTGGDILILALWNLVLFTAAFVAFMKYDVR